MPNFDPTRDDPIEGLDASLASDLQDLYAAPVPAMPFTPAAAIQGGLLPRLLRHTWRPASALGAAALAIAAVLVGPSLWSGESQVNAETIFARTSAAAQSNAPAAGPQSYHLVATTESGPGAPSTTETWYVDADHQRFENEYTGDGSPDFGVSIDGADGWMYGDFGGTYRAVHGPASELGGSFSIQPGGGIDLGQVLGQYEGGCQKAEQDGEDTVAGRAAYRIVVSPDINSCPGFQGDPAALAAKFGTLVIDVDKETFLPLRTEQMSDGSLPPYTYTVTEIQVGEEIPDSTFVYTAPPGVTVVDVTNQIQAKNVISGLPIDGPTAAP